MSNILFCVTGPSGSGKTTLMRKIMNNELLSFTTRPMREGEKHCVDYQFLNQIEFDWLLNEGLLAEHTEYAGCQYGLTMYELNKKLGQSHAFFICDNNGFNQIKEKYDNVVSIFLYASFDDCSGHMTGRGDDESRILSRLSTYKEEMANRGQYDYVITNHSGYPEKTEQILRNIITTEILVNAKRLGATK